MVTEPVQPDDETIALELTGLVLGYFRSLSMRACVEVDGEGVLVTWGDALENPR